MNGTVPHLHNLRDVGGLAVAGGRLAERRLFRSAAPLRDDPAIAEGVRRLGVETIIDLREPRERELSPRVWNRGGLRVEHVPIFEGMLWQTAFADLDELYDIMLDRHTGAIVEAVETVAAAVDAPVLVHCTAGKDRTGIVTGVLLDVLGAERDDVLGDYELSQHLLGEEYLRDLFQGTVIDALPGSTAHRAVSSPRELLQDALARIDASYGGAEALLREHGTAPDTLARLRAALVEAAPIDPVPERL